MSARARADSRPDVLTVRRELDCPPEIVFEAWTDPDALVSWFGGGIGTTESAAVDLRVGGTYRLTTQTKGRVFAVEGVYREVEPPRRLVYTWRWDSPEIDGGHESLVTVEFRDLDGATEVILTHTDIGTDRGSRFYGRGWAASLELLEQVLRSAATGSGT